jgi:catechol 2,3-dioxygenase-like lactoylglutathione lyase family enzyme
MAGNSDMAFEWDGPVEDALAHLHACGVESHTGIVDTFGRRGKARSVYFRDPDGSLLEFITYPDGDNDLPPETPDWAKD